MLQHQSRIFWIHPRTLLPFLLGAVQPIKIDAVLFISSTKVKGKGKGKVHPRTGYEGRRGSRGVPLLFL
jgi:hypothetical protein